MHPTTRHNKITFLGVHNVRLGSEIVPYSLNSFPGEAEEAEKVILPSILSAKNFTKIQ
jgi:hypothetical protein